MKLRCVWRGQTGSGGVYARFLGDCGCRTGVLRCRCGRPIRSSAAPFPAVWKEQHLEFSYMGRTARYSCEGLRDKMRSLLLDLGARRDLTGCRCWAAMNRRPWAAATWALA